ncbi:hypothetical protein [uncultured Tenacibaculum sp.]|uniref:hypothetical protein n=1 Tax=uncultured Tenacibaculum sp. TaxID=174713 RepID=UPI002637E50F|nr:hypothetical protein [uncultured Tenacibaculum sp.]
MVKYFILNDKKEPKEVSKKEYSKWVKNNSSLYNREFERKDGTKDVSLTFQGVQKQNKEISLFSVRSTFMGYDGEIITDFKHEFASLEEATEHYEGELFLNGDKE